MSGMVLKDLYLTRSMLKIYLLLVIMFFVLTLTQMYSVGFFSGVFVMLLTMLPLNTFAYDEQAHWDQYAAATPTGRAGVVRGKYLYTLLLFAICLLLSLVLSAALYFLGSAGITSLPELLLTSAACTGVGLAMNAVLLPLTFQFGAQKSRVAFALVAAATTAFIILVLGRLDSQAISIPLGALALVPMAVVLLFVLSYFISLRLFRKKEL